MSVLTGLLLVNIGLQIITLYHNKRANSADSVQASSQPVRPQSEGTRRGPISDAPPGTVLDIRGLASEGKSTSGLALIEISDYECPFCAQHAANVLPQIRKEFITTGKLKYVFLNFPLQSHQNATLLATAAICGGMQGHYSDMHDDLFKKQPKTKTELVELARGEKLNTTEFTKCLDGFEASKQLARDRELTARLPVDGTPTFALGKIDDDGRVLIQRYIEGVQPFEMLEHEIKALSEHVHTS